MVLPQPRLQKAAKDGKFWSQIQHDLLRQDENGEPSFVFEDSDLKIRIQQPDGSWRVIDNPEQARANGLATSEFGALEKTYDALALLWHDARVPELNNKKELVDILEFDINEFLKVSTRLKARRVFFIQN